MGKWFKKYSLFSGEQCNKIIESVEKNYNKLNVSDDHGSLKISSYEVKVEELDDYVIDMVHSKVKNIVPHNMIQCFVIKYSQELKPDMVAHYDMTTYSMVINLNNDFEGGGTYFPLRRYYHNPRENGVGECIIYRADTMMSWHEALPVTSGIRYVLNVKFRNKKSFIWWILNIFKFVFYQYVIVKIFAKKYV
jgi:hypothetical protein